MKASDETKSKPSLADLLRNEAVARQARPPADDDWERPSFTLRGDGTGTILTGARTEPVEDDAAWAALLEQEFGLPSAHFEIDRSSLQVRAWDGPIGSDKIIRYYHYKASIRQKSDPALRADVDELIALTSKRRPLKPRVKKGTALDASYLICLSDVQMGKAHEEGGGSPETLAALNTALDDARARLRDIERTQGRPERVVIATVGDLIEGVSASYDTQFTLDLNLRQQMRVMRRVLLQWVDAFVAAGHEVTVVAVADNHGEVRGKSGRLATTPDDNYSLALVEGVEEACRANDARYSGVEFIYAEDSLVATVSVSGVRIAATHGHQMRGRGSGTSTAAAWWKGQLMGRQPVAESEILFVGHRHHLEISEAERTIVCVPAFDGGSHWFTSSTGQHSPRGIVTMTVGRAHAKRGWGNLDVL